MAKLDICTLVCSSLIPIGVVLGSAVFEGLLALVGMSWLLRSVLACFLDNKKWKHSFWNLLRHPLILPYFAWYLVIVVSFFLNNSNMEKLAYNLVFARHLFFIAAIVDISRRLPVYKYLLYGLAAGVIWAGFNSFLAHILGFDLIGHPLSNYTEKRHEAPRIAQLAAFTAPFFWGWAVSLYHEKGAVIPRLSIDHRAILFSLSMVAVILVLISDIRTYILAMVSGFILVFLLSGRKARLKSFIFLGGLIFFVSLLFFHQDRFHDVTSINHRFYIWKVSWLMAIEQPFFGVSVSSYPEIFSQYASVDLASLLNLPNPSSADWAIGYHAHNILLMILTVNGIAGILVFLWLFTNSLLLILRLGEQRLRLALASWPAVLLAIGMVSANIYDGATVALFVFFLAIIGCMGKGTSLDVSQ